MRKTISTLRREFKVRKAIFVEKERRPHVFYPQHAMACIRRLIHLRHGVPYVDTDDGEMYVPVLLAFLCQMPGSAREQVQALVPLVDRPEEWWAYREREALKRKGITSDDIAQALQIHEPELMEIDARCGKGNRGILVSMTRPKHVREAEREEKKAMRKKAKRTPREQYEALSISRTMPWIAAGFNTRRTWERHGKPVASTRDAGIAVASQTPTSLRDEREVGATPTTSDPSIRIADEPEEKLKGSVQTDTDVALDERLAAWLGVPACWFRPRRERGMADALRETQKEKV